MFRVFFIFFTAKKLTINLHTLYITKHITHLYKQNTFIMKKIIFPLFLCAMIQMAAFTTYAQTNCEPATITKVEHEGSGNRINWTLPPSGEEVTISQNEDSKGSAFGMHQQSLGVYHRFTQENLAVINGGILKQIIFEPSYDAPQTKPGHTYTIQVYQGGKCGDEGEREPGILISSQELNNTDLLFNEENTITLETPVIIDASQELWIGYFCTNIDSIQVTQKWPVGCDDGPHNVGFGNILFFNDQWYIISEIFSSFHKNWVIKGIVQTIEDVTVNIYHNNNLIKSNVEGITYLHNNPTGEEHCYKVEVNCLEGGVSPFSNVVCISETECHPAINLEVKYAADCSSANLTWAAPQNMSGTILYNIYRNDTLLISNHSATSYQTTNFNPNIVNIWSVKVVCPNEESDAVSVTKKDCTVGVKENGQIARFTVYPNPANNELRITNYELRDGVIEIYDVYGRKQKSRRAEEQNSEGEIVIDIANLSAGIYFVRLIDKDGFAVQRFIKE